MEKLKFNSPVIAHTSKPFNTGFHALKRVFNLHQVQTESMDYFCKHFDSAIATCKLTGCNATIFPGLEKNTDYINDSRQHMDSMCLIKIADLNCFSHIGNELENGTILGNSTNIYRKTNYKAYDLLLEYKTP